MEKIYDIVIVGGLGHVGLPLGIAFADKGKKVCLYDVDGKKAEKVRKGIMPFIEYGAEPILKEVLDNKNLARNAQAKRHAIMFYSATETCYVANEHHHIPPLLASFLVASMRGKTGFFSVQESFEQALGPGRSPTSWRTSRSGFGIFDLERWNEKVVVERMLLAKRRARNCRQA